MGDSSPQRISGNQAQWNNVPGGTRISGGQPSNPYGGGAVGGVGTQITGLQNAANQLAGFNPWAGQYGPGAQGRLNDIMQTGLPTDVSGITEAAKAEADKQFKDYTSQTNEEFGALGLGPSSARQRAISQGAADASQSVANAGLRAQVGAQEAAANRSLGAYSPYFTGTGQQLQAGIGALGGLGTALGTQLGLANMLQQGSQFQQSLLNNQNQFQASLNAQLGQNGQAQPGGGGMYYGPSDPFARHYGTRLAGGGEVPHFASGGRMFGGQMPSNGFDYLTNLAYGTTFEPPPVYNVPKLHGMHGVGSSQGPSLYEEMDARNKAERDKADALTQQKELMAFQAKLAHQAEQKKRQDILNLASLLGGNQLNRLPGSAYGGPAAAQDLGLAALRGNAGIFGLSDAEGKAGMGDLPLSSVPDQRAVNLRQALLQQQLAQAEMDPYGLKKDETKKAASGGFIPMGEGEVPGPGVPPDQVPAMLSGGELIVPPGLRHQVETSNDSSPIVGELKNLINKPAEQGAAGGGMMGRMGFRSGQTFPHPVSPFQAAPPLQSAPPMQQPPMDMTGYGGDWGIMTGQPANPQPIQQPPPGQKQLWGQTPDYWKQNYQNQANWANQAGGWAGGGKVEKVMHEFKHGQLHSGSSNGPMVHSREQAIAIALSEARKHGEKVPHRAEGGPIEDNSQPTIEELIAGLPPVQSMYTPPVPPAGINTDPMIALAETQQAQPAQPAAPESNVSNLGNIYRPWAPGEYEYIQAQQHANALRELALKSPYGARIHEDAAKAQALADQLQLARSQSQEALNLKRQEEIGATQRAILPATIAANASIHRGHDTNASRASIEASKQKARIDRSKLEIAAKAAGGLSGKIAPEEFKQYMEILNGLPPAIIQALAGASAGSADAQAEEIANQFIEPPGPDLGIYPSE